MKNISQSNSHGMIISYINRTKRTTYKKRTKSLVGQASNLILYRSHPPSKWQRIFKIKWRNPSVTNRKATGK